MKRKQVIGALVALLLVTAVVMGGVSLAKRGGGGGGGLVGCPWSDIQCPDVYDPVTCDNGVTYPNACYAFAACATGCGSGGSAL